MNWPWVSRRAFDLLEAEVRRLREHNDLLFQHALRSVKVRPDPAPPSPPRTIEPMPPVLIDMLDAWDEPTRTILYDDARRAYRGSWEPIIRNIRRTMPTDTEPELPADR